MAEQKKRQSHRTFTVYPATPAAGRRPDGAGVWGEWLASWRRLNRAGFSLLLDGQAKRQAVVFRLPRMMIRGSIRLMMSSGERPSSASPITPPWSPRPWRPAPRLAEGGAWRWCLRLGCEPGSGTRLL